MITFNQYLKQSLIFESPQGKIQKYNITDPALINFIFRYENKLNWAKISTIEDITNAINFQLEQITSPDHYQITTKDINWLKEKAILKAAAIAGNDQARRSLVEFDKDPERAKTLVIKNINDGKDLIVNDWMRYFKNNNDVYSPAFKFIILDSILKDAKESRNPPPKSNPNTISRIYGKIQEDPKTTFKINKVYEAFLVDDEKAGLETIISGNGEWIRIPSYNNDRENYNQNVSKLMSQSAPNWCVRQRNMADNYMRRHNSDFWLYIIDGKDGKSAVASVRVSDNEIQEISGTEGGTSQNLHPKYFAVVTDLVEKKDFTGKDKYLVELLVNQEQYERLEQLIKSGDIDFNKTNINTYISLLSNKGRLDLLNSQIKNGYINTNQISLNRYLEDYRISEDQKMQLVKIMANNGYDFNTDRYNGTSLISALATEDYDLVKFLIDNGADVNIPGKSNTTPLMYASELHFCDRIVHLLIGVGADVHAIDSSGRTALILACSVRDANVAIIQMLIDAGSDVNINNGKTTPLLSACYTNNFVNIRVLLQNGADPNIYPENSPTPLAYAIYYRRTHDPKTIELLLNFGADVNIGNYYGDTPLILASKGGLNITSGSIEIMKLLLDRGADPNMKNTDGQPVLALISTEDSEMAELLLSRGAERDVQDDTTFKFYQACWWNNIETVKVFLKYGSDPTIPDKFGRDAFWYSKDNPDILEILEKYRKKNDNI